MLNIGLMGTLVSNSNMGCVALTYSVINMLEEISAEINKPFSYTIFEFEEIKDKYDLLVGALNLDKNRIQFAPVGYFCLENWKLLVKRTPVNVQMISQIKKCDVVIDLTQGDSFTDIYGASRFNNLTEIKKIVMQMRVPLILGPQTYGPFINEKNRLKAKAVIERAQCVISRDKQSAEYIASFAEKKVHTTTDLAFCLPYRRSCDKTEKIRIGINPSGLLFSRKSEGTVLETSLKTNYDIYINQLIETLSASGEYEVHLIPHVGNDSILYINCRDSVVRHEEFSTPIEAKNCIASMDVFIGSRMHATIAAFSAGVATIPVAYSRKFSGLFGTLGYNHVVDLCQERTEDALEITLSLVKQYKALKNEVCECKKLIEIQSSETKRLLKEQLVLVGK